MEGSKLSYVATTFSLGLGGARPAQPAAEAFATPLLAFQSLGQQTASAVDPHIDEQDVGPQVIKCKVNLEPSTPEEEPFDENFVPMDEGEGGDDLEAAQEEEEGEQPEKSTELGEFIEVTINTEEPQAADDKAPAQLSEADIVALGKRPYWMKHCRHIKSPFLRLHQEIVELVELLQPTQEEVEARHQAIDEVTEAITSIWPKAEIRVFGSFATGLFVPTSDIDLVVMNSGCADVKIGLKALASSLMRKQIAKSVQVVANARVPIIKFETAQHGSLAFDVSFDVANGPQSAALMRDFMGSWPMMRPLVLILKLFLQQRELNEVYSGGIGSYALITMVAAFLQLHGSRKPKLNKSQTPAGVSKQQPKSSASLAEPSLGVLLVDFFRLFGRVINMPQVGISARAGGRFFHKDDRRPSWMNIERPFMLSVEDPRDENNDLCGGSRNIRMVKAAFDFAYQQLSAPSQPDESLLARILRLGAILVSRKPHKDPRVLYSRPIPAFAEPADRVERLEASKADKGDKKSSKRGRDGTSSHGDREAGPSKERRSRSKERSSSHKRSSGGGDDDRQEAKRRKRDKSKSKEKEAKQSSKSPEVVVISDSSPSSGVIEIE